MAKAEISWKKKTEDGIKREVYVHCVGNEWKFFEREKRFDEWQELKRPSLDDLQELLDAVRRRAARRLMRPEDEQRVKRLIRESYPEAEV